MPAPARVLVTGGAGFIGIHTVRRLASAGSLVLVIDDLRHGCGEPLPEGVELARVDITTPEAAAAVIAFRPDVILHLAAQGGVSRSLRDPAGDAVLNVVGTVARQRQDHSLPTEPQNWLRKATLGCFSGRWASAPLRSVIRTSTAHSRTGPARRGWWQSRRRA
ncbi:MAG: NAD-dependent epimerase/dehydratase family protein [Chloroflexi bacterium]|nr:MAG: NAD-dependent epimerase/dehydratase family protein [Chloroflexota bacterium]